MDWKKLLAYISGSVDDDPREVFGSTYDPNTDTFFVTDVDLNLSTVTPGGVWSLIGPTPCSGAVCRGMAFNGGALWVGEKNNADQLHEINPATGVGFSVVTVTLAGFDVFGINGLTTDPNTGTLYGIIKTSGGTTGRRLVTIVPQTGGKTTFVPSPGCEPRGARRTDAKLPAGGFPGSQESSNACMEQRFR